jgi:hypothetical protein
MNSVSSAVAALTRATALDLVRRPGFLVGLVAFVAIHSVLPRLGSPAASPNDNASLALELTLATLAIVSLLAAGFTGIRAAGGGADTGAGAEYLAAPHGAGAYTLARLAGITCAMTVFIAACAILTVLLWALLGTVPEHAAAAPTALALLGLIPTAALGAGLGLLLGALLPATTAQVVLLAGVVATRALVPLGSEDVATPIPLALLPHPGRLEVAREAAFGRAVSSASVALAVLATALQSLACAVLAGVLLDRRE